MLGHAGTAMTLDVYADQFDDDQSTTQSFTHLAALEVPVLVFGVHGLADDVRGTGPGEEIVVLIGIR